MADVSVAYSTGLYAPWVSAADASDGDITVDEETVWEASDHLYRATGLLYNGVRREVVRPRRGGTCSCSSLAEATVSGCNTPPLPSWWPFGAPRGRSVHLPGPVVGVVGIKINGVSVPSSLWRAWSWGVAYLDCTPWPATQDLTRGAETAQPADSTEDAWEIVYLRGTPPPLGAKRIARLLARSMTADPAVAANCIPATVRSVSRQGITYQNESEEDALSQTGVMAVDRWVRRINPAGALRPPRVM